MKILFAFCNIKMLLLIDDITVVDCFMQRPTAKELLKHPFIKSAKKTCCLADIIDRYKRWKANCGDSDGDDNSDDDNVDDDDDRQVLDFSVWCFEHQYTVVV